MSALDAAVDSLQVARNAQSGVLAQAKFVQALAEAAVALAQQQQIANRIALGQFLVGPNEYPPFRHLVLEPRGEFDVAPVVEIREGLGL